MKRILIAAAAVSFSFSSPAFAAEVDNDASCKMYSKFAGSMVDSMLPLKMQDFVNMMSGKDPELAQKMTAGLMSKLDGNDIMTMVALGDDATIAGQAAGEVAMATLMSGKATSSEEVRSIMLNDCKKIGFAQILSNQKKAIAASSGNFTK